MTDWRSEVPELGLDLTTLARSPRIDLLDSALRAPQASFGGQDLYPEFIDKAAVLAVRIARNHPLIDGNKRLAWTCLVMFVALNGHRLEVPADDAVSTMLAVAAGELDEVGIAVWLAGWVDVVSCACFTLLVGVPEFSQSRAFVELARQSISCQSGKLVQHKGAGHCNVE